MKQTINQIIKLTDQWDAGAISTLAARSIKRETLRRQLEAVRVQYGSVRLGDVLEGDGQTQARVRLNGKQGNVDLKVRLDPKSGKVVEIIFLKPRETAFVP